MLRKMQTFRTSAGVAVMIVLGVAATAGAGEKKAPAKPAAPVAVTPAAPASAGLTAFVDAKTGKLRQPTPEEARQLAASMPFLSRAAENVQVTQFQDGTLSADLSGTFLNVWVARVNPDGSVSQGCADSPAGAQAMLSDGIVYEDK